MSFRGKGPVVVPHQAIIGPQIFQGRAHRGAVSAPGPVDGLRQQVHEVIGVGNPYRALDRLGANDAVPLPQGGENAPGGGIITTHEAVGLHDGEIQLVQAGAGQFREFAPGHAPVADDRQPLRGRQVSHLPDQGRAFGLVRHQEDGLGAGRA